MVKAMLRKNTPLMTRQSFTAHGAIADATIYGKERTKEKIYIPVKSSDERLQDVRKYGGYNKASIAYFTLVEHTVKGKRVRTLEGVPVYLMDEIERNPQELERYLTEYLELKEISVRFRKVKIQSLIKVNGYYLHIAGKTGAQIILRNAVNLCLNQTWVNYIKKLENTQDRNVYDPMISNEKNIELYEILTEKHQHIFKAAKFSGRQIIKRKGKI